VTEPERLAWYVQHVTRGFEHGPYRTQEEAARKLQQVSAGAPEAEWTVGRLSIPQDVEPAWAAVED